MTPPRPSSRSRGALGLLLAAWASAAVVACGTNADRSHGDAGADASPAPEDAGHDTGAAQDGTTPGADSGGDAADAGHAFDGGSDGAAVSDSASTDSSSSSDAGEASATADASDGGGASDGSDASSDAATGTDAGPGVSPFDPGFCTGPAMTLAGALARFPSGSVIASLGSYDTAVRYSTCGGTGGCPWTIPPGPYEIMEGPGGGAVCDPQLVSYPNTGAVTITSTTVDGGSTVKLSLTSDSPGVGCVPDDFFRPFTPGVGQGAPLTYLFDTSAGYSIILPSMGVLEMTSGLVDPQTAAVTTAVLTDHCLQATFTYSGKPTLSPTFLETQVVFYATF